jgi:hypothetical protein
VQRSQPAARGCVIDQTVDFFSRNAPIVRQSFIDRSRECPSFGLVHPRWSPDLLGFLLGVIVVFHQSDRVFV